MHPSTVTSCARSPLPADEARRLLSRWRSWTVFCTRERRLFWLLLGAWLVNAFDLGFTLLAREQWVLHELNPVAAWMLRHGPAAIILYKLALVGLGTGILWHYRRRGLAEGVSWAYALACIGLALWWNHLYLNASPRWSHENLARELLPPRYQAWEEELLLLQHGQQPEFHYDDEEPQHPLIEVDAHLDAGEPRLNPVNGRLVLAR